MNASERVVEIIRRHRLEKLGYLPCDKLKWLFARLEGTVPIWHLSRESAGVALAFGCAMGQGRAGLLIQSTGLGNLVTELMTLPVLYGLSLPLLVSWRGHYRESIEAQTIMGERIIPMLRGLEIAVATIETPDDLAVLDDGLGACFETSRVQVFLLSPRLWEGEPLAGTSVPGSPHIAPVRVREEGFDGIPELTRYQAIQAIMESLDDAEVLVAQIGFPAREACAIRDRERNLYLLGALGSATLVGIGLAQTRPDLKIVVLDGDGSFILNPNQMVELSRHCPQNLTVVLLDNGSWGSTGSQPTFTSQGLNLAAFGASLGTPQWQRVVSATQWQTIRSASRKKNDQAGQLVHFLIRPGNADVPTLTRPAIAMTRRFQQAISRHP